MTATRATDRNQVPALLSLGPPRAVDPTKCTGTQFLAGLRTPETERCTNTPPFTPAWTHASPRRLHLADIGFRRLACDAAANRNDLQSNNPFSAGRRLLVFSLRYLPLLAAFVPSTLCCQAPDAAQLPRLRLERALGPNLPVPQPPRSILTQAPKGQLPAIAAIDHGLPLPDSAPARIAAHQHQPTSGAFTIFRNRDHRPSGAGLAFPGEPAVINLRDTYFATGNTYGSLSIDSGMTWTLVNPYTLFPANDGGACCDQRTLYVPRLDMVIWYIQYSYSSRTSQGGARVAVCRGRTDLRTSTWSHAYIAPSLFGLPPGTWLDFPDMAFTDQFLYGAGNVYDASGSWQNSVVWRINLDDLAQGNFGGQFYRHNGGSGPMGARGSYRFTQTPANQPGPAMFWATHDNSTADVALFAWDDGAAARRNDVSRRIPTWASGVGSSVGPDGRDWIGNDDHRLQSGFLFGTEGGFLWTSSPNGAARQRSYVRVCRFQTGDRSIVANNDVFSDTEDVAYPACGVNRLGHVGVVMSVGSAVRHVCTAAFLVDNYSPTWDNQTITLLAGGSSGSPTNRWGDYHSVVANPVDWLTFLGTGMEMSGGTGTTSVVHRTAWFGRDDYTPGWVDLRILSNLAGVAISVDATDRHGNRDGVVPFTRSYGAVQGYTLDAPLSHGASTTYVFDKWLLNGLPQTVGQTRLRVDSIGTILDTVQALYVQRRSVNVTSSRPSSGVPVYVSTSDVYGLGNGATTFTRYYRDGSTVTLTAARTAGGNSFKRWLVDGVPQPVGDEVVTLTVSQDRSAVAEFAPYTLGSFTSFGTGCAGSNGPDVQAVVNNSTRPEIGQTRTYLVNGCRINSSTSLRLGLSNTSWLGIPLPFDLGSINWAPGCSVYASSDLGMGWAWTGTNGSALQLLPIPDDVALVGGRIYTQFWCLDPSANNIGITFSNAVETLIGGYQ